MTKEQIQDHAQKESRRVVDELRRENARTPTSGSVPEDAYERLQRLLARKIVGYSSR